MLPRARVALAALTFGSLAAWALSSVPGCAVNRSGLSLGGGGGTSAGVGGSKGGATGTAGAGGGRAGAAGGASGAVGTTGTAGTVGMAGTAGTVGTTGTAGTVGMAGTAGTVGMAGTAGTVGMAGTFGSTGGMDATGGAGASGGAGAAGGTGATGGGAATGAAGIDGQAGTTGGSGQTGGTGGTGTGGKMHGGGGSSGRADCSSFPPGSSITLASDGLLHCYWTHGQPLDWDSSESACENEGGTLATILSAQENAFVVQLAVQDQLFQGVAVSLGATDGKASNDMSGPGTYAWVTGEPWIYHAWQMNQPDGSCNECNLVQGCQCDHRLALVMDGTWYDRPEPTPRPYICEAIAR